MRGRQERRVTRGANGLRIVSLSGESGKCALLAHHRSRRGRRHHLAATFAARCRGATRITCRRRHRAAGRSAAGCHLWLLPAIEAAATLKLHEGGATTTVVAEATAATRVGDQTADRECEQNRASHLRFSTVGRTASVPPWTVIAPSETTLPNPSSRSGPRRMCVSIF
jgi:hypothetical protein